MRHLVLVLFSILFVVRESSGGRFNPFATKRLLVVIRFLENGKIYIVDRLGERWDITTRC